ncbi:sensor histidine kinase [Rhizobium oryzicola]|uniref:histidine kinase n=1 Tax=Rhizobium oryzicola TaxID=1232668 RepID=A0ABT8SZI4_9HYPH|nr:sensor histidine kinase [Rhizobium oryzicola]MDO1583685.1 sensor histidine kinase N-terminal domain-containing protein [Rhizobium oryzicola]
MRLVIRSLRRRLLAWLLAGTAALGMIALADTWEEAQQTANEVSDRVLAGSALAIAERVVVSESGGLEVDIPYVALEMLTSAAQDRVFYRVDGPKGFITGYETLPALAREEGQSTAFDDMRFRGDPIRVATLARSASTGIDSVPFTVTVAETTIARRQLAQSILLHSAARLLLMMIGAAVIVWISVTLSLRPLYRLRGAIARRSPDDLEPIREDVPSEVEGLVETVNSFMVRLQSALEALRHFTGNASHQLRTPLAVIRTQLALAARADEPAIATAAIARADESVAKVERILAQLLVMARLDAEIRSSDAMTVDVNLQELCRDITAESVPRAAEAGIDLGFAAEAEAVIRGQPLLIEEMARNLLSNAILYSGSGAEVTLTVGQTDDGPFLQVEDDGPGIPDERRESVRRRFDRGARMDDGGTGLGLPIVEEIASLHGGRLDLSRGTKGRGLRARVAFPPAQSPERQISGGSPDQLPPEEAEAPHPGLRPEYR